MAAALVRFSDPHFKTCFLCVLEICFRVHPPLFSSTKLCWVITSISLNDLHIDAAAVVVVALSVAVSTTISAAFWQKLRLRVRLWDEKFWLEGHWREQRPVPDWLRRWRGGRAWKRRNRTRLDLKGDWNNVRQDRLRLSKWCVHCGGWLLTDFIRFRKALL